VHPEDRQQLSRKEKEEDSDECRARKTKLRRNVYSSVRAIRLARAEILTSHRGGRAHQSH
jgi:hypothetical protein